MATLQVCPPCCGPLLRHARRARGPWLTSFAKQDRFNINSQLEHLQSKYIGTGHADLTRFEWAVNIHRDSYASYVGHHPMLAYFAIAENEAIGRVRYNFLQVICLDQTLMQMLSVQNRHPGTDGRDVSPQKMLLPCGLPPEREEE